MKIFSVFAIALTFAGINKANAQPQPDPRSAGYTFCKSFTFSDQKSSCVSAVSKSGFVDASGLEVCSLLTFGDDKLNCLSKVVDRTFDPALVSVCKKFTFSDEKISCVSIIGNKFASAEAISSCSSVTFADDRLECIQEIVVEVARPVPAPAVMCSRADFRSALDAIEYGIRSARIGLALQGIANLGFLVDHCFR